jgi:HD-like signal output (HDOD) protein
MNTKEALAAIAAQAGEGPLAFPTHVKVAARIQHAFDDPELHAEAAARLIQADAVLSARMVAVANSAAFDSARGPVADVRSAIARVGFRTARALATAVLLRQLEGKSASAAQHALAAQLWEHTAHMAALAQVLARRVTHLDPEIAMFAGIVHEVGGFYLLSRASEFPGLLDGELDDPDSDAEAIVGRAVLRALAVPERVMSAIEYYWDGFLAMPPKTLGDTLLLAERLAPVASPFHQASARREAEAPASIEMLIGAETLSDILKESAAEVASLAGALRM